MTVSRKSSLLLMATLGAPFTVMLISGIACNMPQGEEALEAMTPEERAHAEDVLMKIERDATYNEVVEILGEPHRNAGFMRPSWLGPYGDEKSQIQIYFIDEEVAKIRWIKLGKFAWTHTPE